MFTIFSAPLLAQVVAPHQETDAGLKTNEPEKQDSVNLAAAAIEANRAAQDYVELLDKHQYAESWTRGAQLFRKTISQGEWVQALQAARGRLGAMKSRTLKDERIAWDPIKLPKGAYMVVEFDTSFERAPQSGELLTLMQEKDGSWKVLTYQVN